MKIVSTLLAASLLLGIAEPTQAQDASPLEHTIASHYPEQERSFTVQLPPSYHVQTESAFPVLYVLDGESNLDFSVAVADFLAQNSVAPELIIVGVHSNGTRARDYLPADGQPAGQADQFLDYFGTELIPFIESTYRAAPLRLLSGHSYGGVFVTYALAERPEMFDAYLTQSPFFDQGIGNPLLQRVSDRLSSNSELDRFFYMNVGNEPNLEQNFTRMEEILTTSSPDAFAWSSSRESDKTHMTTRLVGQYDGIERFFAEDWVLSNVIKAMIDGGPAGLDEHLERLEAQFGAPTLYAEEAFQQTTQAFLGQQDVSSAQAAAGVYVRQYPDSPVAHFLLGVSLASGGERETGLAEIEEAIRLFEAAPVAEMQPLYENMKVMRDRLGGE